MITSTSPNSKYQVQFIPLSDTIHIDQVPHRIPKAKITDITVADSGNFIIHDESNVDIAVIESKLNRFNNRKFQNYTLLWDHLVSTDIEDNTKFTIHNFETKTSTTDNSVHPIINFVCDEKSLYLIHPRHITDFESQRIYNTNQELYELAFDDLLNTVKSLRDIMIQNGVSQ
jgi:hypothetical protein